MPDVMTICRWLETSWLGTTITQSGWIFPTLECIHMFGIVSVVGATSIMDLRLMGVSYRDASVSSLVNGTLRWALYGFALMLVTGAMMFVSEATRCYTNAGFRWKMLLVLIAGVNALLFHVGAYRGVKRWERGATPFVAKFAGGFSVLLWFGIVALGRWIAFF